MNRADMIYDLSSIWAAVRDVFPYFDRLPFDWDQLYRDYLNRLLALEDEAAFHALLTKFLESLNDGHTKYIPPPPFRNEKPFPPPEKPSFVYQDDVLTIRVNDFLTDHAPFVREVLETASNPSLVRLDIRDNIGGNTYYAANVAMLFISGVFHGCRKWTQARRAVDTAGASQLARYDEKALRTFVEDGLATEAEIADAKLIAAHTKYDFYTDSFGAQDHKALCQGPLHILISKRTMSAAEDFTAMFKSSRRGTLIGQPTFGSTGTPCLLRLRCGGRAQVVSVGYRLLDGTEFIGRGIQPDVFEEEK